MRYAILSDIHANRQALNAVLADVREIGYDQIICLGDLVGYGPSPAAVLEKAHSSIHNFVMGNHDAVLSGKLSPDAFNDSARKVIEWTAQKVGPKAAEFLGGFPYILEGDDFCCAHSDFVHPNRFAYMFEPSDAEKSWSARKEKLLFVGHTHVPAIFVIGSSGTTHLISPVDFQLEEGKRYIVNPGSVGQPRDGDARASYCVLDTIKNTVYFRRVPFDVEAYKEDLATSGIPVTGTYFVEIYENKMQLPVRDLLDFTPPGEAPALDLQLETRKVQEVVKSAKRWKLFGVIALVLLIITALLAVHFATRTPPAKSRQYAATGLPPTIRPTTGELLPPPKIVGQITEANLLESWSVALQDHSLQSTSTEKDEAGTFFRITSKKPLDLLLASLPIPVGKGEKLTVSACFEKIAVNAGSVTMLVRFKGSSGPETHVVSDPIYWSAKGGKSKFPTQNTIAPPFKESGTASFVLQCQGFQGEFLLRASSLRVKEQKTK